VSSTHPTRTQTPNLEEKYKIYLASNGEPEDSASNPLNLFDALNIEDKEWFRLAQIYLLKKVLS
jgi:hypothetical protein